MSEELKPTQDVPAAEAKAEGQKLEWGPELGQMSWNEAQIKIDELNLNLIKGEKRWRLPIMDDILSGSKNNISLKSNFYWLSSEVDNDNAWCASKGTGIWDSFSNNKNEGKFPVRFVRDAA